MINSINLRIDPAAQQYSPSFQGLTSSRDMLSETLVAGNMFGSVSLGQQAPAPHEVYMSKRSEEQSTVVVTTTGCILHPGVIFTSLGGPQSRDRGVSHQRLPHQEIKTGSRLGTHPGLLWTKAKTWGRRTAATATPTRGGRARSKFCCRMPVSKHLFKATASQGLQKSLSCIIQLGSQSIYTYRLLLYFKAVTD